MDSPQPGPPGNFVIEEVVQAAVDALAPHAQSGDVELVFFRDPRRYRVAYGNPAEFANKVSVRIRKALDATADQEERWVRVSVEDSPKGNRAQVLISDSSTKRWGPPFGIEIPIL